MSPEDKAEALEHYMEDKLDEMIAARDGEASAIVSLEEWEQEGPRSPRGTNLFRPREEEFVPMPDKPTLLDFYRLRFAPANHVLQSATHALETGQPERTILACLLHDVVQNLMKPDHGWWGAQLVAPYVDERVLRGESGTTDRSASTPTMPTCTSAPRCTIESGVRTTSLCRISGRPTSSPGTIAGIWSPASSP